MDTQSESGSSLPPLPPLPPMPGMWEEGEHEDEGLKVDLKRLLWGVWCRRRLIAMLTTLFLILALLAAFTLLQTTWVARTTLLKKEQLDSFQVGRYGIPFKIQQYALHTLLDTLMLPSTLDEATRRSGVSIASYKMAKKVQLIVDKQSKAFTVSVVWGDPSQAALLANNLVDVFVQRNINLRHLEIAQSLSGYKDLLAKANMRVLDAANNLRQFELKHLIADLDTQLALLLEQKQDLTLKASDFDSEAVAANLEVGRLQEAIENEPEMVVQTSYYVNPLQKKLSTMEWEVSQARGRYTDDNPKVVDLLQRIRKIKALIAGGKDSATASNTYAYNPVRQELKVKKYAAQAESYRLVSRKQQSISAHRELTQNIYQLSAVREDHGTLKEKLSAAGQLKNDLRQRVDALQVLLQSFAGDFEILERARIPTQREASGRKLLLVAALVMGFGLSCAIALLMELLDKKIRTLKDVSLMGEFGLLLEFQHAPQQNEVQIDLTSPTDCVANLFRSLINDMQSDMGEQATRNLAIVSAEAGAGRSSIACNLGKAISLKEASVLLVDADLRPTAGARPESMGIECLADESLQGLLSVGAEEDYKRAKDTIKHEKQGHRQGKAWFKALPAAPDNTLQDNDPLMLGGRAMQRVREQLAAQSDWVLYDLPPLLEQEAAFEATVGTGQAILVIRSGHTRKSDAQRLLERLQRHRVKIVAVVLSDVPQALMVSDLIYCAKEEQAEQYCAAGSPFADTN